MISELFHFQKFKKKISKNQKIKKLFTIIRNASLIQDHLQNQQELQVQEHQEQQAGPAVQT